MELSILQFAKDNHPRAVSIGAVADMIRAGNIAQKLNKESVDLAFTKLGFESILSEEGDSGYLAVRRTVEEIQSLGAQMAYNARRAATDEPF